MKIERDCIGFTPTIPLFYFVYLNILSRSPLTGLQAGCDENIAGAPFSTCLVRGEIIKKSNLLGCSFAPLLGLEPRTP